MATAPSTPRLTNDYPTSARFPVPETDWHRILMLVLIETLDRYFAARPRVYVSGNLLLFYEQGNRRKHVSPDVFVVQGVAKHPRPNYLLWEEGRGPNVVIELTSKTTRRQDTGRKLDLYRDTLKVREYFLFDPHGEYLDPQLQGYNLHAGQYRALRPVGGRLPSRELGLHLEADGDDLRLYDPATNGWVPTFAELIQQTQANLQQTQARLEQTQTVLESILEAAPELRQRFAGLLPPGRQP
jgi:Uma2 family endonuclease